MFLAPVIFTASVANYMSKLFVFSLQLGNVYEIVNRIMEKYKCDEFAFSND